MAAYMGHVLSTVGPKILLNSVKTTTVVPCRFKHNTGNKKKVKLTEKDYIRRAKLESKAQKLASRGFLRNLPSYNAPADAAEKLNTISQEIIGTNEPSHQLNHDEKFQLLIALNKEFSHVVPNSLLYRMTTLEKVFEFYQTSVTDVTPFDRYKEMELPPNLHILYDYHRFHPDTDTMFGGKSAFFGSSNLVPSLRYRKKYKGFVSQDTIWPDI